MLLGEIVVKMTTRATRDTPGGVVDSGHDDMVAPAQRAQQGGRPQPGAEALLCVHQDTVATGHHALYVHLNLAVQHRPACESQPST